MGEERRIAVSAAPAAIRILLVLAAGTGTKGRGGTVSGSAIGGVADSSFTTTEPPAKGGKGKA